ncbi:ABC transporter permease [Rhodophyticola sp. CCM32]|uniref:ABC transporter permease n=1 Tax=Rhodophyticola sp. CCM32 TaxID=2916397 RepID=UPI00107F52C4|nr:ABC transporter permease [Rhodophyticola sp. CCM32]QBY01727.1 ABC transporter permease [Rhodophyticola sp. CCM32]
MNTALVFEILFGITARLWPALIALLGIAVVSVTLRDRLGAYGRLWTHGSGTVGLVLVLIWVLIAVFASQIAAFDPLQQYLVMQNRPPGAIEPETGEMFLLGADRLARDVFSRIVYGSQFVLSIAPTASALALVTGLLLGLPAGYHGGKIDTALSFLANLILAFPVILIFYLLVSPGVSASNLPRALGGIILFFPLVFIVILLFTRFSTRPLVALGYVGLSIVIGLWLFVGFVFDVDPTGLISISPGVLNIFVAVVLVACPGLFRVVRGLTLDVCSRDYVAAAQTRGESSWYIMLWEILPNVRGPLIVDFCLRIGFTTILLGTLGFFGLGLEPESPDWGTSIKDGSALLRLFVWPALFPALALMSLVLGLNLLADAIREISLED